MEKRRETMGLNEAEMAKYRKTRTKYLESFCEFYYLYGPTGNLIGKVDQRHCGFGWLCCTMGIGDTVRLTPNRRTIIFTGGDIDEEEDTHPCNSSDTFQYRVLSDCKAVWLADKENQDWVDDEFFRRSKTYKRAEKKLDA